MSSRGIVFFDGDCLFCQARVRWLRAHDRYEQLAFEPLQGEKAHELLRGTGLVPEPEAPLADLTTMVFVAGEKSSMPSIFTKSRAVAAVAARLPFPWRLGGLLAWVPRPVADAFYDWVAHRRHRWGEATSCEYRP